MSAGIVIGLVVFFIILIGGGIVGYFAWKKFTAKNGNNNGNRYNGGNGASNVGASNVGGNVVGNVGGDVPPSEPARMSYLDAGCWAATDGTEGIYKISPEGQTCWVKDPTQYSIICGNPWTAHKTTSSFGDISNVPIGELAQCTNDS